MAQPVRRERRRCVVALVYGSAAVLLVPWIFVLADVQPPRGITTHLDATRACLVAVITVLSACVVVAPRTVLVTGPAAATFAFLTAWFHGVTVEAATGLVAAQLGALLAAGGAAIWTTVAVRRSHRLVGFAGRALLSVFALGGLLGVLRAVRVPASEAAVQHLKTVWVGLDLAEVVALAGLALAVWTGAAWVSIVGSVAASLLVLDALINIVSSSGVGRAEALLMGLIELPLAAGALAVAIRGAPTDRVPDGRPAWLDLPVSRSGP